MTLPLRFAVVPIKAIERPSFCDHGESRQCCWDNSGTKCCQADRAQAERDASPGSDLLQRIVCSLESAHGVLLNEGFNRDAAEVQAILDALQK